MQICYKAVDVDRAK